MFNSSNWSSYYERRGRGSPTGPVARRAPVRLCSHPAHWLAHPLTRAPHSCILMSTWVSPAEAFFSECSYSFCGAVPRTSKLSKRPLPLPRPQPRSRAELTRARAPPLRSAPPRTPAFRSPPLDASPTRGARISERSPGSSKRRRDQATQDPMISCTLGNQGSCLAQVS